MSNNQVVSNSSEQVATQVAASTGTSGGSAGNNTTAVSGATPATTAVVAPKGFRQDLQQMLQGWQAVIPIDSAVMSSEGSLPQAAVLERLQTYLGQYQDLDAKVTAAKQAHAQVESQLAEARQYFAVLKSAVTNQLGPNSPQLAQFGLKPKKVRKALNASQLAVKAAKAKATRALRGTIGATKKAQIKSGSMKFVEPVVESAPNQAPVGTAVASTAPPALPTSDASSVVAGK
jgi:hypothetical protein